jgi:hypothetical protein
MSKIRPTLIVEVQGDTVQNVLAPAVSQHITIGSGGSTRNSVDFTTMIIAVTPQIDCIYKVGTSTVVAKSGEDHFIPADVTRIVNVGENTRIAVQARVSGETGIVYISEMS